MSQESSAQTPIELCVIEGDGIGREVIPAAVEVLKACGSGCHHPPDGSRLGVFPEA